jgi:hypothetical protein
MEPLMYQRLPGSPGSLFFDFRRPLVWRKPMRALIIVSALFLAACGGDGSANNAAVAETSGTEQVTAVNDVTAIDAATGQDADMAADVNYTFNEAEVNALAGDAEANAPRRSRSEPANASGNDL